MSSDAANKLESLNEGVQYGKIFANSMIDSRSVCSIITKTLAKEILKSTPAARLIIAKWDKDLKSFTNEPIKSSAKLQPRQSKTIGSVKMPV